MSMQGQTFTALGSVNAFDPTGYQVQVLLQAETEDAPATVTGWIPLASPWTGNGWGMFAPASTGDLILVFFQDGSLQNPIAGLRLFYNDQLPIPVEAGEMWLVHKSGSSLKFKNDGTVSLESPGTLSVSSLNQIDLTAPTVNINADTACNINAGAINLNSVLTQVGPTGGTFQQLFNVLSQPTVNLEAT